MIINKAFFGKNNCLKVTLSEDKQCYFHFGVEIQGVYKWKKVKFQDIELGEMIKVLRGEIESKSFFHTFKDEKTIINMNKKNQFVFFKVEDISKSLNLGEQETLKILLKNIIWMMNVKI